MKSWDNVLHFSKNLSHALLLHRTKFMPDPATFNKKDVKHKHLFRSVTIQGPDLDTDQEEYILRGSALLCQGVKREGAQSAIQNPQPPNLRCFDFVPPQILPPTPSLPSNSPHSFSNSTHSFRHLSCKTHTMARSRGGRWNPMETKWDKFSKFVRRAVQR